MAMTSGFLYEITFPIVNVGALLSLLLILGGIGYKAIKGKELNLLFTIAFVSVLNGGILFIAANLGLYFNEFLSDNAIKLGSAGEVIFLSMAMAGRYRQIQAEKEEAQKEAYVHLESINKITQNQKERLENIVVRRTAEIKKASSMLEEKNKEIIDSINYAKRIQDAILPSNKRFFWNLPQSFITYLPKDIVAGDFYWLETAINPEDLEEKIVLFAAADCTGHGVPGAMVSVVCSNALNRAVREYSLIKPNEILDKVAIMVEETFSKSDVEVKDGMDISLCAYFTKSKKLWWAGANNPLYIISNNPEKDCCRKYPTKFDEAPYLYEIKANKQPVGKYEARVPFDLHELTLEEGETFYSFSDGFADQFGGEKGKKYKTQKLKEYLRSIYSTEINHQGNLLESEFHKWRGQHEQIDDVCMIGVKV